MSSPLKPNATTSKPEAYLRGLVGGIIGGVAGFLICWGLWGLQQGIYAVSFTGIFLGLGCGTLSRVQSFVLGAVCAVAGFAACLFTEWWILPFAKDDSLNYFVANIGDLPTRTWIFVVIGALVAGWFGTGRERMIIHENKS